MKPPTIHFVFSWLKSFRVRVVDQNKDTNEIDKFLLIFGLPQSCHSYVVLYVIVGEAIENPIKKNYRQMGKQNFHLICSLSVF